MRIEKIEISNYKSISNQQSLSLHNDVTTIIGKNESGKSNVLDCIGNINVNSSNDTTRGLIRFPSRNKLDLPTEVSITFVIDEKMKEYFNVKSQRTKIEFNTNDTPFTGRISSGFGKEFFDSSEYVLRVEKLRDILTAHFNAQHKFHNQIFYTALPILEKLSEIHNLNWKAQIQYMFSLKKHILNDDDSKEFYQNLEFVQNYINRYYDKFPEIFYYKEENLNSTYAFKKEDFNNLRSTHGNMLVNFIRAVGIDEQIFQEMMLTGDSGRKQDLIDELVELINENVNKQFNAFYPQERVSLVVRIENNTLRFFVKGTSGNINISERSNGLKWYLNLYITILSNNIRSENLLFVIDEPGVYLHVDAQKELRRLFYNLPYNYQILYSTHSPFMISEDHISDIKVIQKNKKGETEIVNSVFSEKILDSSKKESLSPILKSIGMSQEHILGIHRDKINVITEGITDAVYLRAIAKYLDEDKFVFIPAVGASNIYNLGLILWSWGMRYVCLYDYDKAGIREQTKAREKYGLANTINLSSVCNGENITIEDLIDKNDFELCGLKKELVKKSESKMIDAVRLSRFMDNENIVISNETKLNFATLFDEMAKLHG